MPFVQTPSATLHYEDRGAGPPVVLVHGWSLSSRAFLPQLEPLAREHRVIAPDLRGHGRSRAGAPDDTRGGGARGATHRMQDFASDLTALFEHLSLEGALLVGWSLGAQVALEALPGLGGRVRALALVSGTPRFAAGGDWPHGLPARSVDGLALKVRRHGERALAGFFAAMFTEGELPPDEPGRLDALVRGGAPAPDPAALLGGLDALATSDQRHLLGAVAVPALLVHGDRDATCLPGASAFMAERIAGACLERWPGVGHAPQLSRADALTARLVRFAREAR